ncbi:MULTISPECIES: LacI family DNA-binding transcriptional regulator [unclassified Arthrobacter]|uniref:LacI family DNA-binding transcriptional regulator n=1 Tax=unclassified Arthrobacter TaxID=235627 RepID=UPI00298ED5E3|nr:LacI family DNA-binding transcriptional regulator [Arthrobacter sp. AET 35A]
MNVSRPGEEKRAAPRAANIRDVARAAGISHQTVSRVINGHASVRESTRLKVLAAMEELQFRPSRAARMLVTSRSGIIGVLVSHGAYYGPSSSLAAIESAARDAGYLVDIANVTDDDSITKALDRLVGHAAEGLIIQAPQFKTLEAIEHLSIDIPFVTVHSTARLEDHRLSVDQVAGARLATRHLLELGHRRIVHVTGPKGWVETGERIRGFRVEMSVWGAEAAEPLVGDWTAESGYRIGKELLRDGNFTAVFSSNDQMALGLIHAFREGGLDVPRDISVVGFDDIPEAAHFLPPLTTVRQDFAELGRRCIALLLADLRGEPETHHRHVVPELVVRNSAAAPPEG